MIFNYHWNRDEQQKYAEHRLFRFIRNSMHGHHPYYDKIFAEAEVNPRELNIYKHFQRIPLTTFEDFAASPTSFILNRQGSAPKSTTGMRLGRMADNAGGVLAAFKADSLGERRGVKSKLEERAFAEWQPVHYEWMEGDDGPLPVAYTLGDMKLPVSHIASMLFMAGYRPGMRLFNLMPCNSPGWMQILAAQWLVHPAVSIVHAREGAGSTEAKAAVVNAAGSEFLLGDAGELNAWLDAAAAGKAQGEPGLAGLRKVLVNSSLDSSAILELKKKLARAGVADAQLLQGYSSPLMRALFFECSEGSGIHLNPEFFFWEVLDPESREPVKWGEPGVLTFSHFDWHGTVLLRYWTGDLVEGGLYWERCPGCGLIMPLAHTPITPLADASPLPAEAPEREAAAEAVPAGEAPSE